MSRQYETFQGAYANREAARKMVRLSKFACMITGKAQQANSKYRIRSCFTIHMLTSAYTMLEESQKAFHEYNLYYESFRSGVEPPSAWINSRLQDFIDAHFLPDVPPCDSWIKKSK
ncbi:MAG: hypothetical protein ACOVQN_00515 [Exiguobacterium sp.]